MAITKDELLHNARQNINIVNAEEAQPIIDNGAILLDIREPSEFDAGHLPNAVHIPRGLLEFMVGNNPNLSDFSKPIVVYCKNGGRSTLAADLLQNMGFEHIHMLEGGFDNWAGTVHKVEIPDNQYQS
ncbi:rhodanese-like domain-containing protein [Bermanella sp. R86510]|uniref:rhodanese-like domain-containing protein n=1 Tax=unclassified Bermanella TaxID=2627862 RepID=UPI0037C8ECCC